MCTCLFWNYFLKMASSSHVNKRLSYLIQLQNEIIKLNQSNGNRLSSFYGHLIKEISLKNQINSLGMDQIKRGKCKHCHLYYRYQKDHKTDHRSNQDGSDKDGDCSKSSKCPQDYQKTGTIKTRIKSFIIKCNGCHSLKTYKINTKNKKTHFERTLNERNIL